MIAAAGGLGALIGLALALAGMTVLRGMFVGLNVATLLAHGYDKCGSQSGGRRVPEAALHILAAGGTPGAFLGQLAFRHKTRDRQFRTVFWAIAIVQVIVLLAIAHLRSA